MATEANSPFRTLGSPEHGRGLADPQRSRALALAFWFYVGVPLLLGFLFGWLRAGRAAGWPLDAALIYWIGVSLILTAISGLATAVIAPALRRLGSPLWLTLFVGQIAGGVLLADPALRAYRSWMKAAVYPDMVLTIPAALTVAIQRLPSNTLLWVGLNLLFFHALRMARFGYVPATSGAPAAPSIAPSATPPQPPAPPPGDASSPATFMERVREERRGALFALQAEGHYLRVHTDAGSDLILYRLSDAMNEIATADGAQVHRSWWVAERALSSSRHRDVLSLRNGQEVPVSRSFRLAARQRGWLKTGDYG